MVRRRPALGTGPRSASQVIGSRPRSDGSVTRGAANRASPRLMMPRVPVDGELDQLRRRAQVELLLDPLAMGLDGLHREIQSLRDLSGGLAAADEVQHLQLSIAQTLARVGALLASRDREPLDHARTNALAHVDA